MTEMDDSFFRNSLGIINKKTSFDRSENLCEIYDVRMQSIRQRSRLLSGGNVQKLLLGRWLIRKPKIIMITCKYCIMDTTCQDISFNIEGRCNYCLEFEDKLSKIKKKKKII